MKKSIRKEDTSVPMTAHNYSSLLGGVSELLESARRARARTVNAFMTATYWKVGVTSPTLRRHIGRHADPRREGSLTQKKPVRNA